MDRKPFPPNQPNRVVSPEFQAALQNARDQLARRSRDEEEAARRSRERPTLPPSQGLARTVSVPVINPFANPGYQQRPPLARAGSAPVSGGSVQPWSSSAVERLQHASSYEERQAKAAADAREREQRQAADDRARQARQALADADARSREAREKQKKITDAKTNLSEIIRSQEANKPYSFFHKVEGPGGLRNKLKEHANATIIAEFNKHFDEKLVSVRSGAAYGDSHKHFGLTADKDEAQHAMYHPKVLGIERLPGGSLCPLCLKSSIQFEFEHRLPFTMASAYVGLTNGSDSGNPSPMLEDMNYWSCSKCNSSKSNIIFLNFPNKQNGYNWGVNGVILDTFCTANEINEEREEKFKIHLLNIVNRFNGYSHYDTFLIQNYRDINNVKRYLTDKRININGINDNSLRKLAHFISGLEIAGLYICLNEYITPTNRLTGITSEIGIKQKIADFDAKLQTQEYINLRKPINDFIQAFARDFDPSIANTPKSPPSSPSSSQRTALQSRSTSPPQPLNVTGRPVIFSRRLSPPPRTVGARADGTEVDEHGNTVVRSRTPSGFGLKQKRKINRLKRLILDLKRLKRIKV